MIYHIYFLLFTKEKRSKCFASTTTTTGRCSNSAQKNKSRSTGSLSLDCTGSARRSSRDVCSLKNSAEITRAGSSASNFELSKSWIGELFQV